MVSNGASTCMKKVPKVGGLIEIAFQLLFNVMSHIYFVFTDSVYECLLLKSDIDDLMPTKGNKKKKFIIIPVFCDFLVYSKMYLFEHNFNLL